MDRHIHQAQHLKSEDRSWTECITPTECAASPARQEAHGNIVRRDTCICGAYRDIEINRNRKNYGPWQELLQPEPVEHPAVVEAEPEHPVPEQNDEDDLVAV